MDVNPPKHPNAFYHLQHVAMDRLMRQTFTVFRDTEFGVWHLYISTHSWMLDRSVSLTNPHFSPFLFNVFISLAQAQAGTTSNECVSRPSGQNRISSFVRSFAGSVVRMCVTQKRCYQFRVVDVIWFTSVCTYLQMNFYHYYCKWAHVCHAKNEMKEVSVNEIGNEM